MQGDIITIYELQKYVGMWETEQDFENEQEAQAELSFCRKFYPEYKWRLKISTQKILWESPEK